VGFVVEMSYSLSESFVFPLDDPYIHLQFARNLVDHGAWSFFGDEMVVSGSSSPLFTFLEAVGLALGGEGTSVALLIGIASHLCLSLLVFQVGIRLGAARKLAWVAALATCLMPRLLWASVSGMETSLFMAITMAAFLAWQDGRWKATGGLLGLAVWARPEGCLFAFILLAAQAMGDIANAGPADSTAGLGCRSKWYRLLLPLVVLACLYMAFNLLLGGHVMPGTVGAKAAYYQDGESRYWGDVVAFLAGFPLVFAGPFVAWGTVVIGWNLVRRRFDATAPALAFVLAMIAGFSTRLPYLFQHGRYLMPILPFLLLVGLRGAIDVWERVAARFPSASAGRVGGLVSNLLLAGFVLVFVPGVPSMLQGYQNDTDIIANRQVATALWLRQNVPADSLIATHDIGAIGLYSGLKVLDLAGLVSPQMVGWLRREPQLAGELRRQGVSHVAVLPEWLEAVNSEPMFVSPGNYMTDGPMLVFKMDQRLEFTGVDARDLSRRANDARTAGRLEYAVRLLGRAAEIEPNNSRVLHDLARALAGSGRPDLALLELDRAISVFPGYWQAWMTRAQVLHGLGRLDQARTAVDQVLSLKPDDPTALQVRQLMNRSE
jgi:hypothetical protein